MYIASHTSELMSESVALAPPTQPLLGDGKRITNYDILYELVIFPRNVATDTQFIILQMQGLLSGGHGLSHH